MEDLVEEGGAPQMDGPVDVAEPPASEDESDLLPSPVLQAGSILGPREEGVPEEVHAHIESLPQCGAIPVTHLNGRETNELARRLSMDNGWPMLWSTDTSVRT